MIECGKADEIFGAIHSFLPDLDIPFSGPCVGSYNEGTQTEGMNSDIDQIIVIEVPVVSRQSDCFGQQSFLMVKDITTPPGYAKLHACNPHSEIQLQTLYGTVLEIRADKYNRSVVKLTEKNIPTYHCDIRQGPAFKALAKSGMMEQDYVWAFRHKNVTACLKQWFQRQRWYNWPNKQLMELCMSMGCLLVNVGHRKSDEYDIEWRISFSLQERLLVTNFNSVQLKCFILLKLVQKEIIQKHVNSESFSSYHCKTCMLYMIENTPPEFWTLDNLLNCLVSCLKLLMAWIAEGNCPNYFIPSQNMFDGRLSCQVREAIYQVLKGILASNCQYLTVIKSDDLGQNLAMACLPRLQLTGSVQTEDNHEVKRRLRIAKYRANVLSTLRVRNSILFRNHDSNHEAYIVNLMNTIHRCKSVETLSSNTREDTHKALALILPHLELSLISNRLALKIKEKESGNHLWTYLTSKMWDEIGAQSDPVSAKLKQATFMYVCGHYDASLNILASVENYRLLSVCYCDNQHDIYPGTDTLVAVMPTDQEITLENHFKKLLTPCVVFLPPEGEILPPALRYEMFRAAGMSLSREVTFGKEWYTWVVVDAQVLLHFMFYLNHKKMKMTSHIETDMKNMLRVIREENISHIETALNLFGWMHHREQMYEKARGCYQQSLYFQPQYNAARWHIRQYELEAQDLMNSLFPIYTL